MSRPQANALVPAVPALPATEAFNMPAAKQQEIREAFKSTVEWNHKFNKSEVNSLRTVGVLCSALFGVVSLAVPPMLFITLPAVALLGIAGTEMQKGMQDVARDAFEDAKKNTLIKFEEAQREFYSAQKRRIIELADAHLGNGHLISAQDAAWLGNIDPDHLSDATDQLAVTVLQIRQMLAYQRCASFNSDGSKQVDMPLTFKDVGFDISRNLHRSWLREKLAQLDSGIEEDERPEIRQAEFVSGDIGKSGRIKAFFNFFNPVSNWNRKEKTLAMELPQVKDIEVQCVQPIAGFAEALEAYEARNPPLDLPAMRGWKSPPARRALTSRGIG
jgi:hypothetical protein